LGVSESLPASRYQTDRAAVLLRRLLRDSRYQNAAELAGSAMREEHGAIVAANRIEAALRE